MEFLRIKETCLYVHDLNHYTFYHNLLDLSVISYVEKKHVFFRAGSSVLLFFNPDNSKNKQSPPAHYGGGKQHFAFEVRRSDYEKIKSDIILKGIKITDTVLWKNRQESFYFEDPAGNVLEIVPEGIWD